MKLEQLSQIKAKGNKRIGRGLGSGKGKTGGRGTKGQKARGKIQLTFIGGTLPLYRKLPFKRGKGNSPVSVKPTPVNLDALKNLKPKTIVDLERLVEAKIIRQKDLKKGVKILGRGGISVSLVFKVPVSKQAREKIENAGGEI